MGGKEGKMDGYFTFSESKDAIAKARRVFSENPDVEWVIVTGDQTIGGVFYKSTNGDVMMVMVLSKSAHVADATMKDGYGLAAT